MVKVAEVLRNDEYLRLPVFQHETELALPKDRHERVENRADA
jgi:hypothetical protein